MIEKNPREPLATMNFLFIQFSRKHFSNFCIWSQYFFFKKLEINCWIIFLESCNLLYINLISYHGFSNAECLYFAAFDLSCLLVLLVKNLKVPNTTAQLAYKDYLKSI